MRFFLSIIKILPQKNPFVLYLSTFRLDEFYIGEAVEINEAKKDEKR